ncbi:MAG TPA: hypothetical protein VMV31_00845 [Terriglobales bacterium]|nr:hypothetical protein [Terriglobales bacterium]
MIALGLLAALGLLTAILALWQPWRCRHRFGWPTWDYVCCLRCTRRFPIQYTPGGEWHISKIPLALDDPGHPPGGSKVDFPAGVGYSRDISQPPRRRTPR